MTWLSAALSTYLILAVVFLVDKYLLTKRIPDPRVYTFLVGLLGGFAILLIPFVGFSIPGNFQIFLSLLSGALYILALLWFYNGLQLFEASRVVPAITGILPLFTFGITFIFSRGEATLSLRGVIAFLLLLLGSVLITYEKRKDISFKCLRISILTACFLALSFVLAKYVYLAQAFWSGFIWIRMGGVLMAIIFLFCFQDIRKRIFQKKEGFSRKTSTLFLVNQGFGALAIILQNWAIALAPLAYIAVINALQGTQYVFLLIFALIISFKFPQIIKEEASKEIIIQKVMAILLIGSGLFVLSFK
jgi:drug/metabolite transporter (DMT)-like permease